MLVSRIRHTVYNKIAMQYRRFNRDKNWRTETIIDELTFKQALEKALLEEEKRQALGIQRHEVKAKPKPKEVEMPSPIGLLPEQPKKPLEEIGSVETKRGDNTGFDDLEDLLKQRVINSIRVRPRASKVS